MNRGIRYIAALCFCLCGLPGIGIAPRPAMAGGLTAIEPSAASLGRGGVLLFVSDDPGAFSRHPAALTLLSGTRLMLSANVIIPTTGFTPSNSETDYKNEPIVMFPPVVALSHRLSDNLALGISGEIPFISRIEWPSGWPGAYQVTRFEWRTTAITPAIAFAPTPWLSLGLGANLYLSRLIYAWGLPYSSASPPPAVTIDGQSGAQLGFQGSVLLRPGRASTVALTYTSGFTADIPDADVVLDQESPTTAGAPRTADASLALPQTVQLAASLHPFDSLSIGFEVRWSGWSSADTLRIQHPLLFTGYGIRLDWQDSWSISVGGEFSLGDIGFRAGLLYDMTPVPDQTMGPIIPDATKMGYSLGVGYRVGPGLRLDFGAMLKQHQKRSVDSGTYQGHSTELALNIGYYWK